jgi:hypothetical protein
MCKEITLHGFKKWVVFVTYFSLQKYNVCVCNFAMEPPKVQVEQVVSKDVENHFTRFREGVCVCVKDIIESG